jgi:hypothetical protein
VPEKSGYRTNGVVAAAQGMQLSREGIYLAVDGTGLACYRFRKPKKFYSGPSDISREHTIIATYAGPIAQQKFYPDCSVRGGNDDQNLIESLLLEIEEENPFPGCSALTEVKYKNESKKLVGKYWPAIVAVATALWAEPPNFDECGLSSPQMKKKLDGESLIKILQSFGIHTSLCDLAGS